jgi:hypothetical protein
MEVIMKNIMLSDYCRWNQPDKVKKLLEDSGKDIDITYDDGNFFRLAISKSSTEILNTLLNHFETTKLTGDKESISYKAAHYKLREILEKIVDEVDISPEIQKILNKYLPTDDESSDEQDLSGFEDELFDMDKEDNDTQNRKIVLGSDKDNDLSPIVILGLDEDNDQG